MYGLWMSQALLGQTGAEAALDFLPLIFIGAIMYFIIIRPESKRKKEHAGASKLPCRRVMRSSLRVE